MLTINADSFIIYRNTEMKAVRQKYPGIGNNDVCKFFCCSFIPQNLIICVRFDPFDHFIDNLRYSADRRATVARA
jgi:hypothetical protein